MRCTIFEVSHRKLRRLLVFSTSISRARMYVKRRGMASQDVELPVSSYGLELTRNLRKINAFMDVRIYIASNLTFEKLEKKKFTRNVIVHT